MKPVPTGKFRIFTQKGVLSPWPWLWAVQDPNGTMVGHWRDWERAWIGMETWGDCDRYDRDPG